MVDDIQTVLTRLDSRMTTLDSKLAGLVTDLRHEMLSHFDAIYKRFDRLESAMKLPSDHAQ